MGFVTFRKTTETYYYWKFNDDLLTLIATLLIENFGRSVLHYMSDPKYENKEILGDMAYVRLIKNHKIVIGTQYAQGYFPEITVDRDNLKEVIEKWEQLRKANIDEIVLKRDKTKLYIIGRSLTEEEKLEQERILKLWQDTPQDLKWDQQYLKEFQNKYYSFSFEEIKQLEREFYSAIMDNELTEWNTNEQ